MIGNSAKMQSVRDFAQGRKFFFIICLFIINLARTIDLSLFLCPSV